MPHLPHILNLRANKPPPLTPRFFDFSKTPDRRAGEALLRQNPSASVTDDYQEQLRELFAIQNPNLVYHPSFRAKFKKFTETRAKSRPPWQQGNWVYFPWSRHITHILPEQDFFLVRTARNKLLITAQEQNKFYNAKIGIGGLSVGSSVATALALQGGAKFLRLADFDRLALSNTNRIRSGVQDLGRPKIEITARQIYEINPYAKIDLYPNGLTEKNVKKFLSGLDVMIDELDNLAIKLLVRIEAKKLKIPVIMGADNGDTAVIDIERYDKNPKLALFHNRLGKLDYQALQKLNKSETGQTIAKLIGLKNHSQRMLLSLKEIGKSIVSWPQLGGTAQLNGAAIAYCVRKILNNQLLEKKRLTISLGKEF